MCSFCPPDYSLHKFALAEGLLADVLAVLEDVARLRKDSRKFVSSVTVSPTPFPLPLHPPLLSPAVPQRDLPTGFPCQVQLAPALAILSYLVHGQEGLRADLSATPSVLPRLFLAAVLVQDNPKALYHASTLISYLAFSGVGYFTAPTLGRGFALPIQLLDRCVTSTQHRHLKSPSHSTPSYLQALLPFHGSTTAASL